MMKRTRLTYAAIFCILLLTEIGIGLFVHDRFVRPYIGDILVTILLCCFCRILFPKSITALPVFVFLFASLIEFAQYFDVVKLMGLENSLLVSTLIGRTFSPVDLICYGIGCFVFWLGEMTVNRFTT